MSQEFKIATQVQEQVRNKPDAHVMLSSQQIQLLAQADSAVGQLAPIPYQYVNVDAAPPIGRVRIIGGRFVEVWTPRLQVLGPNTPIGALPRIDGWEVRQYRLDASNDSCGCVGTIRLDEHGVHQDCGRKRVNLRAYWDFEANRAQSFADHVRGLHVQAMSDFEYDGHYAGIPGKDTITFDKQKLLRLKMNDSERAKREAWRGNDTMRSRADNPELRNKYVAIKTNDSDPYQNVKPLYKGESKTLAGGTRITGGRRQWRSELKQKGLVLYDSGYQKHKDRLRDEQKAKQSEAMQEKVLKTVRQIAQANSD